MVAIEPREFAIAPQVNLYQGTVDRRPRQILKMYHGQMIWVNLNVHLEKIMMDIFVILIERVLSRMIHHNKFQNLR